MRRRMLCFITMLVCVFCGGCGPAPVRTVTLPSGKAIVVTSVVPMFFPNGDHVLVMNCETDIPIDDHVALRKEVDEVSDVKIDWSQEPLS